jgi:hypothetical protein
MPWRIYIVIDIERQGLDEPCVGSFTALFAGDDRVYGLSRAGESRSAERMRTMGHTLGEMIDALPKRRRERVAARYRELKEEVESLSALRKAAGKAQADIADGNAYDVELTDYHRG